MDNKEERARKHEAFKRYANSPGAIQDQLNNYSVALSIYAERRGEVDPMDLLVSMMEITGSFARVMSARRRQL